jgi:hypothetical protein
MEGITTPASITVVIFNALGGNWFALGFYLHLGTGNAVANTSRIVEVRTAVSSIAIPVKVAAVLEISRHF